MTIPGHLLSGKKILLGVTGSIAVYKACDLVRHFIKAGAEVRVIMSDSAKRFVTPLTFESLSQNKVLDDTTESWADEYNHIAMGRWADAFVIAPATANTLNKLAAGIADNLMLQTALAFDKPLILSPAANTRMLSNPATCRGIVTLHRDGHHIIDSEEKLLACKEAGKGAMAEPLEVFWHTVRFLMKENFWENRDVIITGGGSIEKVDDVRYVGNFSSGKMASALASALHTKGAQVHLLASRWEENLPKGVTVTSFDSAQSLDDNLRTKLNSLSGKKHPPYLFMAAAVADYAPDQSKGKFKKESIGMTWQLQLTRNRDILANLDKTMLKTVGFKAETDRDTASAHARNMLTKKTLDAVCLNIIDGATPFGGDHNEILFITRNHEKMLPKSDKLSVAFHILESAKAL